MTASRAKAHAISGVDARHVDRATLVPLAPVADQAVALDFAGSRLSSEVGVVLRKDIEALLGFTRNLAAVLSEPHDPGRINCTRHNLIPQRVLQIAAVREMLQ